MEKLCCRSFKYSTICVVCKTKTTTHSTVVYYFTIYQNIVLQLYFRINKHSANCSLHSSDNKLKLKEVLFFCCVVLILIIISWIGFPLFSYHDDITTRETINMSHTKTSLYNGRGLMTYEPAFFPKSLRKLNP